MRATKRAKLEQAGWRVGDAAEFLDLTPDETLFIELKLALAAELKRRRMKLGLSQTELAERVGSSQSRVAKMETGDRSVSLDLLVRTLLALGVSRGELAKAMATGTALGQVRPRS